MATEDELLVFGRKVSNTYREVSPEYTSLQITQDDGNYDYTVLVDTRLVGELRNFKWYFQSTNPKVRYTATALNVGTTKRLEYLGIPITSNTLLLHRLIAFLAELPHPEGCGTVDHISRNTDDNRVVNLRWATRALQSFNTAKHAQRKEPIADEIPHPLPKYMNFRENEPYGKKVEGKERMCRSFFRIEGHPAQRGKRWATTKSNKVSNIDKYRVAIRKLNELNEIVISDPEENLRAQLELEFQTLLEA